MVKILILISILQINVFSKESKQEESMHIQSLDSIIIDFVNIDNKIDLLTTNSEKDNLQSNLLQIRKDIEDINTKQTNMLINSKISKEDKDKLRLIKLYSSKIKIKISRLKKSFDSNYRMSPVSKKTNSSKKDLISLNNEKYEMEKELDKILLLSNKTISSSKWLYNISK